MNEDHLSNRAILVVVVGAVLFLVGTIFAEAWEKTPKACKDFADLPHDSTPARCFRDYDPGQP